MTAPDEDPELTARLLDWYAGAARAVCDVVEPWAHGTVVRASAYPDYWDYNLVRVSEAPAMDAGELRAFADEALDGLTHRRFDFDSVALAEPYRAELEAEGWYSTRLVWMRHRGEIPAGAAPGIEVEEVPYDEAQELREAWHVEDYPETDPGNYHAQAREVAMAREIQVLVSREGGRPVSFAQILRDGDGAEVTQVYVHPDHRGGGRGTAMTRAAIEAASGAADLWICADADDRAKDLYARLGFEPVTHTVEITKRPE